MSMLVEVAKIPKLESIVEVPLENKAELLKVMHAMRHVCASEGGIGLSAVQIGIPWKLFVVRGDGSCPHIPANEFRYFANCEYEKVTDATVVSFEGCLSIRSEDGQLRHFLVKRFKDILVKGLLVDDQDMTIHNLYYSLSNNEQGIVFQHEIDHHRSILISEIGEEYMLW